MHHSILAAFLCLTTFSHALDPTRLLYQFPNNTWVENLFVRPSGSLLVTLITTPELYLIDPLAANPQPQLVHRFDSSLWLTGITETANDTYYVIGANATYKTLAPTPGSNQIYRVHFPGSGNLTTPETSVAAVVKDAGFLNGLITLNPSTLLAADSNLGVVWAIDVTTGVSRIVLKDPLLAPVAGSPLPGINGIRLLGNTLYFTNLAQDFLATVRIYANGTAAGPIEKVVSAPEGVLYDDFALNRHGDAFLSTSSGNSIQEVSRNGSLRIIAGAVNSTGIDQPTSAQFGRTVRDRDVLYVTTAGSLAFPQNGVVGGQVVAVDTRGGSW